MAYFYWRYTPGTAKSVFRNKTKFLTTFKKFIHRQWIYTPESTFEDFVQMVSKYDCIIKPCDGKLGKGIFKTYKDAKREDDRKFYDVAYTHLRNLLFFVIVLIEIVSFNCSLRGGILSLMKNQSEASL